MSLTNQKIDSLAAHWAARRALRALSPQEEAEFEAWLAADIRHLGAYGRAEAVLCRLERLNGVTLDAGPTDGAVQSAWNRRHVIFAGGAAAGVVAAIGVGLSLSHTTRDETYSTAIGQMRQIVLDDGSVVSLNTNSQMTVRFSKEARNITLFRGEALFDVAKNKSRPFIVSAGDTKVRAVGTSFTVSVLPKRPIEVLVREGIVELARSTTPAAIPVRASANIQALAPIDAPIVTVAVPEGKLVRDLAWQRGRIAFDNQSLEDAANEFARYSEVRIVVAPAVSHRTVTGLFASNDPVGFAKAAAGVLGLRVEVRDSEIRIF